MYLSALAVGVAFAMLLYFRNRKQHYGKPLTIVLFVIRALIGSLVTMLLFNPYIRQKVTAVEQPTVVLAHDNSASLVLSKDSTYYKTEYLQQFGDFKDKLERDFQVDAYLFGQEPRAFDALDYDDQLTDIASMLKSVEQSLLYQGSRRWCEVMKW